MSTSSSVKNPGTAAAEIPDMAITTDDSDAAKDDADRCRAVRERFQVHQTFWSPIHEQGLLDDRFRAGDHWPSKIKNERIEDGRPCLTYNLLPAFCRQITNKMREEKVTLKVTPVEGNRGTDPKLANTTGTKDYSLADVYAGVWKNIEHISRADQCYDTAAKHAVDHGFGYFYLMPQWSKLDPFVQDLVLHRVKNSYTVLLDPDAQEADYRDMQDAFMFTNMRRKTFERKYPDSQMSEFAGVMNGASYDGWWDSDHIRVAQYLWLEYVDDESLMLSNGKIVYYNDVHKILDDLEEETGVHIVKNTAGREMRKKVKRPICMWQKMTANEILEGPTELPFSAIPIFPVLGEEMVVDGIMSYESAIRHAHDAQRSYNYWRTAGAETVALAPKNPWILTDKQIEGNEAMFEAANNSNLPYLTYKFVEGHPVPQRSYPTQLPVAELGMADQDAKDLQTIIGLHDASMGKESNEKSGKAIIARQNQGNTATFQFPDNRDRAIEQAGRCAVEAIPKLFDTRRIIRIRMPDGSDDFVEINQAITDGDTGQEILMHDIAYGKYDVVMDTGPSYATQRQEAADLQIELLKTLGPERAQNIVHLIVGNLGVPGSEEVARIMRKMLPEALKSEEEKEKDLPKGVTKDPKTGQLTDEQGQPWQPEPTLEQQIQMKTNEIEDLKAKAEMKSAEADIAQAEADLAKADVELQQLNTAGQEEGKLDEAMGSIKGIIEAAMAEHGANPDAHDAMDLEGKIADAIVDALQRTRAYVDKQIKSGALTAASDIKLPAPSSAAAAPAASSSSAPATPAIVIEAQEAPRPARLKIRPDPDNPEAVIVEPEYASETKPTKQRNRK